MFSIYKKPSTILIMYEIKKKILQKIKEKERKRLIEKGENHKAPVLVLAAE